MSDNFSAPIDPESMDRALATVPLFAALEPSAAARLRDDLDVRHLPRGHTVFAEGDPGDRLFVVISGKVNLFQTAADGRENMLAVLGPGEMFGELSLFDPGPRTSTCQTITEAVLASLGHSELLPWLDAHPEVALPLLGALARRLRRTNDMMSDLVFTDVPGRVAKTLLSLAERFGRETGEGLWVQHDLTQEQLAQLVGASRETVNKTLSDFASRGWLRVDGRAVLLIDRVRLAGRAH